MGPLAGVGFCTQVGLEEGVAEYAQWFAGLGDSVGPDRLEAFESPV